MAGFKIVSAKEVLHTRIFTVTHEKAVAPGGAKIEREIVRHGGSAVMLARDGRGHVLLVRQFRLPAGRLLWELPAGRLDPGESPLRAAKRELAEETGYRARRWKRLVSFYPSPGYCSERMTIFLAEGLQAGNAHPEDGESIEARWFTPAELRRLVRASRIEDGKTLVGLLWLGMWR